MIMAKDDYLILELMRFGHEVLHIDEVDYLGSIENQKFSPKEVKMAEELIEGMTAKWNPEQYKDTYAEEVMGMIQTKVEAGEGQEIDWGLPKEEQGNTSKVVDLMPLLKKSLEERKKTKSGRVTKKKSTTRKRAG